MASLSLKHIFKVYDGKVKAVNDFCMDIKDKEFIVLLDLQAVVSQQLCV